MQTKCTYFFEKESITNLPFVIKIVDYFEFDNYSILFNLQKQCPKIFCLY